MTSKARTTPPVRFCNKALAFTDADVKAKLAKVKDDNLTAVRRYYVLDANKRRVSIPDVMLHMAGVELVWRKGQTGNLVGTYSTAQAMRVLVRLKVKVYDSHNDNKIIPLSAVMGEKGGK